MTKIGSIGNWLGLALVLVGATSAWADPPPVEAYATLPGAVEPRLSPDGEALALITPVDDFPVLMVRRLDGQKTTVLSTGGAFPNWFHWKTSDRLLASLRFTKVIRGDIPYAETRLVFVDADGANGVPVKVNTELPAGRLVVGNSRNRVPQFQDRVISLLPDDPDHLLMAVTPENGWTHPEVLKVDIHSGQPTLILPNQMSVVSWFADADGVVRAGVKLDRIGWGGKEILRSVIVRATVDSDWKTVHEGDVTWGTRFDPVGFSKTAPNVLYVLTKGEGNRLEARPFDLVADRLGPPVAADAGCDVQAVERDRQLIGFSIPCRADGLRYLDEAWQRDLEEARAALQTTALRIIDRTADGKRALIAAAKTASAPPAYWLLDRRGAEPQLRPLGGTYQNVPPDRIAEVTSISFPARDGLTIPAQLALPVGHGRGDGPIAFVVLPHGGPTAHDSIGFNWIVQFLISRGYGVLQPQFRGSSGYGPAFQEAGYQQWGRAMQDDVTDGTRWLIDQKLADPAHICIVGANYGGYAALMGVVKEPGLYACAAAFAPITDLDLLLRRREMFAFKDVNIPRLKAEGQSLNGDSPVENAEKIQVPVLLMHGRKDFTVPVRHSEEMESALHRAGRSVDAIYLDKADHFFSAGDDRLAWLSALDRFLAANLRPPVGN